MEWLNEKDYYKFEYRGYTCEIIRHEELGYLCGYVYTDLFKDMDWWDIDGIECHEGLSYNNVNKNGEWKIGFDCGHCHDIAPYSPSFRKRIIEGTDNEYPSFITYKNVEFVTKELHNIVDQLISLSNKK